MRYYVKAWRLPSFDIGSIGLLVILFSTNVGITTLSGSNRSFRFVMYGLGFWVGN